MRKLILSTTLSLGLALPLAAGADDGPRSLDRELPGDTLTLDEQEQLPAALEQLAAADAELKAATLERDAASLRVDELATELIECKLALDAAEVAAAVDPANSRLQGDVDAAMARILLVEKALDTAKQDVVDKQTAVGEPSSTSS